MKKRLRLPIGIVTSLRKAKAKVVSNIYRHAQICHNANKKYLNSLTVVEDKEDIEHEIEKLSS